MLRTAVALRWSRPDLTAGIAEHVLALAVDRGERDLWSAAAGWAVHGRALAGDAREAAIGVLESLSRWEGSGSEPLLGAESALRLRVELAGVAQDCGDPALARRLLEPWARDTAFPADLRLDGLAVLVRCALDDARQQLDELLGAAEDAAGEVSGALPGAAAALLRAAAERGRGRAGLAVGRARKGLALLGWRSTSPDARTASEPLTAALASQWIGALLDDGRADEARAAAEALRSRLQTPTIVTRQIAKLRLTVARATAGAAQLADTAAALSRAAEDASTSDTPALEAACRAALAELHEAGGQLDSALTTMRLGVTAERLDRERSIRFRKLAERLTVPSASAAPRNDADATAGHGVDGIADRRSAGRRSVGAPSAQLHHGTAPAVDAGRSTEEASWAVSWLAGTTARPRTANQRGESAARRAAAEFDESAVTTSRAASGATTGEPIVSRSRGASGATGESSGTGRRAAESADPPSRGSEPVTAGTWTAWEAAGAGAHAARGSVESVLRAPPDPDSLPRDGSGGADAASSATGWRVDNRSSTRSGPRHDDGPPTSPGFVLSGSPLGDALASEFRGVGTWPAESWDGETASSSPTTAQPGTGPVNHARSAAPAWPADVWASGSRTNGQVADGRHDPTSSTSRLDRLEISGTAEGGAGTAEGGAGSATDGRVASGSANHGGTARPSDPDTSRPGTESEPTGDAAQAASDWLSSAIAELDRVWGPPPSPMPATPPPGPEAVQPATVQMEASPPVGAVVVLDLVAGDQRIAGSAARTAMRRVARRLGGDLPAGAQLRDEGPGVVAATLPGMDRGSAAAWLHRILVGLADGLPAGPELTHARLRATVQDADGVTGAQILHELGPSTTKPLDEPAAQSTDTAPGSTSDQDAAGGTEDVASAGSRHAAEGRRPFWPDGVEVRPGSGGRRHRRGPGGHRETDTQPPKPSGRTVEDPSDDLGLADLLAGALAAYRGI